MRTLLLLVTASGGLGLGSTLGCGFRHGVGLAFSGLLLRLLVSERLLNTDHHEL